MDGLSNLGIDLKNIVFYIVNIGIFVLVLWYFLYEPIIKTLNSRQQKIADTIDEADKIKNEFEKKLAEMSAEQLAMQAGLKAEMEKMEKFIEEKKSKMMAEVEVEKNNILEKAATDIEKRKKQLIAETEKDLLLVIKKIIVEIVENKIPQEVVQKSVEEAWNKYGK